MKGFKFSTFLLEEFRIFSEKKREVYKMERNLVGRLSRNKQENLSLKALINQLHYTYPRTSC